MIEAAAVSIISVCISVGALRMAYVEGKTEGYAQAQADCDNANHAAPPF